MTYVYFVKDPIFLDTETEKLLFSSGFQVRVFRLKSIEPKHKALRALSSKPLGKRVSQV